MGIWSRKLLHWPFFLCFGYWVLVINCFFLIECSIFFIQIVTFSAETWRRQWRMETSRCMHQSEGMDSRLTQIIQCTLDLLWWVICAESDGCVCTIIYVHFCCILVCTIRPNNFFCEFTASFNKYRCGQLHLHFILLFCLLEIRHYCEGFILALIWIALLVSWDWQYYQANRLSLGKILLRWICITCLKLRPVWKWCDK